jgi:hypothetical protein
MKHTIPEGSEVYRDEPEPTINVLPAITKQAIVDAQAGGSVAWGKLYRMAAVYMRDGSVMPVELGQMIAQRLEAIGSVLIDPKGGDRRKVLPEAVAPDVKRGRRPAIHQGMVEAIANQIVMQCGLDSGEEEQRIAIKKMASLLPKTIDLNRVSKAAQAPHQKPVYSEENILITVKKIIQPTRKQHKIK